MKTEQARWCTKGGWGESAPGELGAEADLVFVFAAREILESHSVLDALFLLYPKAIFCGCSSAGEISDVEVTDDTLVMLAVAFEKTTVRMVSAEIQDPKESAFVGETLVKDLIAADLKHVFILSDGLHVNGTDLVSGARIRLPQGVTLSGGLAGDGDKFQDTLVLTGKESKSHVVNAIGFYSDTLSVSSSSLGGWDQFGLERRVTRSEGSVLYELDGHPALEIYKEYLGEHASELPASGLLFPLSIKLHRDARALVRTILGVDEEAGSITFAGTVPEGAYAQFMMANIDRLVDGAIGAAESASSILNHLAADFAVLVSCVGRKMVLGQRVEEEVEGVREVFGPKTNLVGYYSYGEIAPFSTESQSELHNQTMTITAFRE